MPCAAAKPGHSYKITSKNIQTFEMFCYRKLLKVSWRQKIKNDEIRRRIGIKTGNSKLFSHIRKQKLSFFGHIKRHDSLEKIIMEGRVDGKRSRGRPRRQWRDDIESWLGIKVEEAGRLAMKRKIFRERVWAATSQRTTPDGPRDAPQW